MSAEPVYVLITQCLQNDFFFNLNCRLRLPADAAGKILVHPASTATFHERRSRRSLDLDTVRHGPLGRFLSATVAERLAGRGRGTLHLVNVRDWHVSSDHYDRERRCYGTHCEAGRWGADYPDGLVDLLDPTDCRPRHESADEDPPFAPEGIRCGRLVIHHVHSNTLFDLERDDRGGPSELVQVLDRIIPGNRDRVHVAVIGVYTDIKVQIVLQSLRTAYNPRRLVVSDSLTASPTLERHLAALDFAHRVLWVEVMHGVADLARFLGNDPGENEELESAADDIVFADYAQYFADKQSITTYEDTQLRSYRHQMAARLRRTVFLVNATSIFLIACGAVTLGSSAILAVLASRNEKSLPVALPFVLLGLSVVQVAAVFFSRPVDAVTDILGREATFRMLLESRSLRLAIARYHLTTRDALRGGSAAAAHTRAVSGQLKMLLDLDKDDFVQFERFGRGGPGLSARTARGRRRQPTDSP